MIKIETHLGDIEISHEFFAKLVGYVASSCFGVSGMATSGTIDGLKQLVSTKRTIDKGVRVRSINNKLIIEVHIIVSFGVNISAIVKSIINKIKYTIEDATGLEVSKVNVCVDGVNAQ
jgi:uncharacterized alkaline shock family protein YloU